MQILPLPDWDDSLQYVVDDMGGRPLNIHALLANHPRLLAAWWNLRMYLVNGGDLEQRHAELAILQIARQRGNWYEWASHVLRGLDNGLTPEEIEHVLTGSGDWQAADAGILAAIDEIARHNALSPAMRERLAPHFNERQLLDLIFLHGMYQTIDCVIATWGLQLDAHIEERLPERASEAAFRKNVT
ncbi:MAG: carboxymuconolactone decarboxylase family protein [Woeseiaceae bacterium]|nr:carboxymuconolactone decarboxylase family protein [Woeseiaceae bacterium]